jgi:hypothetical protein
MLDDSYICHISRGGGGGSGSGDRPTLRRHIAPIPEEVSDMIHAKEIKVVFLTPY